MARTALPILLALTCILTALGSSQLLFAQVESESVSSSEPSSSVIEQEPIATAESFDTEAATRAYLDRLTPEEKERSDSYFEGGYWLQLWGFLYGLAIAWLFLGTGLSAKIRDFAERTTKRRPLQTVLYALTYSLIGFVLGLPLAVYKGFFREHKYDLATQTFRPWFQEQLIALGVGLLLSSVFLVVLYGIFRRLPRTWWLWGAVAGIAFLIFAILIAPVYIDPLFNTYVPLEDEQVREPILSMARASGIDVDKVYQFDASKQSKRISANVSGFMGTMSIRLNDNLLERCDPDEIKAVMGHEIGHYALNHVYESIVFFGVVLVIGFGFVRWSFDRVVARWGEKWGVRGIGDVAGLPLLAALFSIYFFALFPVFNTYIRVNEAEADIYGLDAAREPDGFAEVAMKLAEYRKLDPGPLEEWIFFDHPSGRARVSMAMNWKAENLPAPPAPIED